MSKKKKTKENNQIKNLKENESIENRVLPECDVMLDSYFSFSREFFFFSFSLRPPFDVISPLPLCHPHFRSLVVQ